MDVACRLEISRVQTGTADSTGTGNLRAASCEFQPVPATMGVCTYEQQ